MWTAVRAPGGVYCVIARSMSRAPSEAAPVENKTSIAWPTAGRPERRNIATGSAGDDRLVIQGYRQSVLLRLLLDIQPCSHLSRGLSEIDLVLGSQ